MADPLAGLYEQLITEDLRTRLGAMADTGIVDDRPLASADAADRLAWHLGDQVERVLRDLPEDERVAVGVRLVRELLERLPGGGDPGVRPAEPGTVLHAVHRRRPDGGPDRIDVPLIPLLDTTLLTNAPGEPTLWSQLRSEIHSADAIDVVMAFIRRSDITPLRDALRRHCAAGRALRILTTTYTDSTEQAALDDLASLGAQIRISYDVSSTRLHAKAWVFRRNNGWSTAYVGSSNLTRSAQVTGIEWNVRASSARNRSVLEKVGAVFDSYWATGDFVPYDAERFRDDRQRRVRDHGPTVILPPTELRPHPFQVRLLELLDTEREKGRHRNLLVSATGTGKTVMAALDYFKLRQRLPRSRLLFVAHRREILDQSLATFRHALREPSFGEKWVDGKRPTAFEHVFASIQSLAASDLLALPGDHFDVVVVDEFHHAAAPSYRRLLDLVQPCELLGMTATPERSDGLPILGWFGDRIAAELRVWDAIDQQHLVPFVYYGIHDGMDLRAVPWRRGRGYDTEALTGVFTSNDAWARLVINQLNQHVEVTTMRAFGFCVSVAHARFMAAQFNRHGIPAVALDGDSPREERGRGLADLRAGRVRAVFSVDLFNEGIDLPTVDTVLMLRPTDSPVLFLQQLGRGLRRADGKAQCTVLDFVGLHRREFRFDLRLRALLGGTRRDVERAVQHGFPFLPAGCHMALDRKASEIVLRSLKEAIPSQWPSKVAALRSLAQTSGDGGAVRLTDYLADTGLDLEDVYDGKRSWSDLRSAAGLPVASAGPHEPALRRAIGRMLHVDDRERLEVARWAGPAPTVDTLSEVQRRLWWMLAAPIAGGGLPKDATLQDAVDLMWTHPQVRLELAELADVLADRITHVQPPQTVVADCPLRIHARYSRTEILAALAQGDGARVREWREGVLNAESVGVDALAFTLDKSGGGFSPTTRYRDYAISRSLIHWESQSTTPEESETGRRYREHRQRGRHIFLFARRSQRERAYWFLGPAAYLGHVGERPMAITWELEVPLSGDLFQFFAAAVA